MAADDAKPVFEAVACTRTLLAWRRVAVPFADVRGVRPPALTVAADVREGEIGGAHV